MNMKFRKQYRKLIEFTFSLVQSPFKNRKLPTWMGTSASSGQKDPVLSPSGSKESFGCDTQEVLNSKETIVNQRSSTLNSHKKSSIDNGSSNSNIGV